jgi:hypothetical protein
MQRIPGDNRGRSDLSARQVGWLDHAVRWLPVADTHDRDGYRDALCRFLAILEFRLEPPARFEGDAELWCAALVIRAQRLLVNGLHLADRDGPQDGAGVLARAAYESAIVGAWLLGGAGRVGQFRGDLTRRHEIAVSEIQRHNLPDALAAILEQHRKQCQPSRLPPFEQIVDQVADWVSESEPVLLHQLVLDGEQVRKEPVRHDGEPYRSSYSALYRMLSTYEVHGAGTVEGMVDLDGRTLRRDIASRRIAEPTEVLVLVGMMVADVASRLLGHRPLRPESSDRASEDQLEWEACTMRLRAAARAVTTGDPNEWFEFLAWLDSS